MRAWKIILSRHFAGRTVGCEGHACAGGNEGGRTPGKTCRGNLHACTCACFTSRRTRMVNNAPALHARRRSHAIRRRIVPPACLARRGAPGGPRGDAHLWATAASPPVPAILPPAYGWPHHLPPHTKPSAPYTCTHLYIVLPSDLKPVLPADMHLGMFS